MALDPSIRLGDLDLTSYPYAWEFGGSLGKPELVTEALEQQLQDGEVVSADRSSNREIAISVLVEAADLRAQADAESALALECAKPRNTLTYDPGDGNGPVTVFDTFVAEMEFDRDDVMEQNGYRRWKLTIPALPFPRTDTLVATSVPAPPTSVNSVTIDGGTATTGWSGDAAVTTTGTRVQETASQAQPFLRRTGLAASMTGYPYLRVTAGTDPDNPLVSFLANDALSLTNMMTNPSLEVDAASWSSVNPGINETIARSTTRAYVGSASMSVTKNSGQANSSMTVVQTTRLAATPGTAYSAQVRAWSPLATSTTKGSLVIRFWNSTGTEIGDVFSADTTLNQNAWTLVSVAGAVAPAGTATVSVKFTFNSSTGSIATGTVAYLDAFMLETGSTVHDYFDGDTTASGAWYTKWTGTRGASSSELWTGDMLSTSAQNGNIYWLQGFADPINSLTVVFPHAYGITAWVDDISKTNAQVIGGTGRQNARQVAVKGSARSQASLALSDPAAALGNVLVYTTTDSSAHQPPLRTFLQAGPAVSPDSTTVSGQTTPLTTSHTFSLPANGVPSGGYLLLARVKATGVVPSQFTVNLSWSGTSVMGSTAIGGQSGTTTYTFYDGNWKIVTVAALSLPPTELGTNGKVQIGLSADWSGLVLDEAWLFNMDSGRLTWVDCGSGAPTAGGPSNRLWLDPASTADPKPSMWRGTLSTRADAVHAGIYASAWGVHEFVPPLVNVFTVTTDSTAAALELDYYPRWHTHVGTLT